MIPTKAILRLDPNGITQLTNYTHPTMASDAIIGLARRLFETTCRSAGGKNLSGEPFPSWEMLTNLPVHKKRRDYWIALANRATKGLPL